jgi:hypothetical protein
MYIDNVKAEYNKLPDADVRDALIKDLLTRQFQLLNKKLMALRLNVDGSIVDDIKITTDTIEYVCLCLKA